MSFVLAGGLLAGQTKAVFYMTDAPDSVTSFVVHADQIGVVIPTVYKVDEHGLVWGEPNPRMLATAAEHKVPVMPIIVNPGFDQKSLHSLMNDTAARQRMISSLLSECKRFHYYGIQFDFEHVSFLDRDALTSLVRDTAAALGQDGYKLSIATVHMYSDYPGAGDYAHWIYQDWRGGYDLKQLAQYCEFLSVMAYDQHTGHTTPGPVAGFNWVKQVLDYSLSQAPKEKISLGIPLYGRRWYAGFQNGQGIMQISTVSAKAAGEIAELHGVRPEWDAREKSPWFFFYADGEREYVFYDNSRSFKARYDLALERGLHSFSAWVLGTEDEDIWKVLPPKAR